jgi:iron(III) transport system substrate-binding protein
MPNTSFTRRDILKGGTALAAATVFAEPLRAAPPAAEAITPALIEAAKKEGKVAFYTAMDLAFAQRLGKLFEEKFPGIAVRVERSGAERIFTRIGQEYSSNIRAVDVVNTADAARRPSRSRACGRSRRSS